MRERQGEERWEREREVSQGKTSDYTRTLRFAVPINPPTTRMMYQMAHVVSLMVQHNINVCVHKVTRDDCIPVTYNCA